ncbi:single-stranded DNA-binding protein 3-like isoform X3 [Tachypleus tridentatus]|uniref:single-stranded DNA-binding protein 3-like isoform X3 n=1 Tax=Tachypleus tridentatus TaxID=6853 RepID=UPI003FD34D80
MYAKGKGSVVPSDSQAREKLALYVYEYLLHVGAQKAAQTFLSEIRWEKNITLGEPPGFLHSWWCVFWDLYCAAPERRDTCEHSSEAKAFHDYGFVNSGYAVNGIAHHPTVPSPLGQMPPNDGMPGGPMTPAGFFPNTPLRTSTSQQSGSQPSPHPQPHGQMMQNQAFIPPRYPGGPRTGVRMPQQVEFNPPGGVPGQPMMPNSMDPSRQGPPGMNSMNPRMNSPRCQSFGPLNPGNYGPMRPPPNNSMGPAGPGMSPMSINFFNRPGSGGRPWQPNSSKINYTSSSPGSHYGPPVSSTAPPLMSNHQDSSNSGGDAMYTMMKSVPAGSMSGFPMGLGPDGPMGPMGPDMGAPLMNGDGLDGIKTSPANGPGTPREDGPPMVEYGIPGYGQDSDQNESEAILKIKESMQEEAKRFEKDSPPDRSEYFMQ